MNAQEVKISTIKSNPSNPRLIKDEKFAKLVQSIREFPEMLRLRPIVVNDDMVVLGGNMRLKACKEAGLKVVPIINASDLTEDQQRQFIIKDNVGYGEWDWEMLANEWDADKLGEWGLDVPKWTDGHDINTMPEDVIIDEQDFDPLGDAKNLHRVVFIFDNEDAAAEYFTNRISDLKYKRTGGGMKGTIWQINMSDVYGK
jgi:hypothetical protein